MTRILDNGREGVKTETLGPHQDRPRDPPLPPASALVLVRLERE